MAQKSHILCPEVCWTWDVPGFFLLGISSKASGQAENAGNGEFFKNN